ncbi:MAG: cation diffusion facilitator family transporter [Culicoidibacterales bacterium]
MKHIHGNTKKDHIHEHDCHDHDHKHSHSILGGHNHHDEHTSEKNLWIAFGLNIIFVLIEVVGGLWTGSTAILSDALHDLGDSIALGLSAWMQRISTKKAPIKYNFGWKRLPVLAALLNIVVLTCSTVFIVSEALPRLFSPEPVHSVGMVWIAIVGIIANGLAVWRMQGSKKILDRTVMLHLLEDLLGWVAVLIVGGVIAFTDWYWMDPLLSLVISAIMFKNIVKNARIVCAIIMGVTLDEQQKIQIEMELMALNKDIQTIEKFQLWSLDGEEQVACLQLRIRPLADNQAIIKQIRTYLVTQSIYESTIECIEYRE